MGFQVPRRQARVTFDEGHEYHGAEVLLNLDLPVGFLFEFERTRAADVEAAFRMFIDDVVSSWNVEQDGAPVRSDYDGAKTQPAAFLRALMDRWMSEATAAPVPLGQRSSDTGGSAVQSTETGTG